MKYLSDYIDILDGKFFFDPIKLALFFLFIACFYIIVFFISLKRKDYPAAIFDFILGFSQVMVIAFSGNDTVWYGLIINSINILVAFSLTLINLNKKSKL